MFNTLFMFSRIFLAVLDALRAFQGVLLGTVRDVVLKACRALGVEVVLQPPAVADVAEFEGAFISSTSQRRQRLPTHNLQRIARQRVRKQHPR